MSSSIGGSPRSGAVSGSRSSRAASVASAFSSSVTAAFLPGLPAPGTQEGGRPLPSYFHLVLGQKTALPTEETNGSAESPLAGEGVGARVTAVFTAAEKAAEHIMSLAREEADDIRRRTHADIDTYRQECRNTAEQEAQRIIQAAHDHGGRIEKDARAAADELERAARERRNRLLEETHLIEERVEWAREGLREVVSRLEQVASPDESEPEPATEPQSENGF